jgi:mRNA interferase RelE/StbE
MSRVVVHKRAAKYLATLPRPLRERIKEALVELSTSPLAYPGVIQMGGDWTGYYRIRVGDFRTKRPASPLRLAFPPSL